MHTEETKRKIAQKLKGRIFSEETRHKMSLAAKNRLPHSTEARLKQSLAMRGAKNPNYGKPRPKEVIAKAIAMRKNKYAGNKAYWWGKRRDRETCRKISESRRGKYAGEKAYWWGKHLSEETKKKIGQFKSSQIGPNAPNWKGGLSLVGYSPGWGQIRRYIRERDGHLCQMPGCGISENGRQHCVHHIDYNKLNNLEDNLILLCLSHHRQTNGNREYWRSHLLASNEIRLRKEFL